MTHNEVTILYRLSFFGMYRENIVYILEKNSKLVNVGALSQYAVYALDTRVFE